MSEPIIYGSIQEMMQVRRGAPGYVELEKAKKNSKKPRVKLIDVIEDVQSVVLPITADGKTAYRSVKFEPGTVYLLPKDDVGFLNTLKERGKIKKQYDSAIEEKLKKAGVEYEVIKCPSCGGKVRKIEYQRFAVIGDE